MEKLTDMDDITTNSNDTTEKPTRLKFQVNLKGVTKFRPPSKVSNRILYGLMLVEDIKTIEMARKLGVSQRAVERWISEGIVPKQPRQDMLAIILKCPPHILFSEVEK